MDTKPTLSPEDDSLLKDLIRRFRHGERDLIGQLVGRLWPFAERLAVHWAGTGGADPGGFLDDVLERFPAILDGYRETPALCSTWFAGVLKNSLANHRRRLSRRTAVGLLSPGEERVLEAEPVSPLEGRTVRSLLAGLRPKERRIVCLRCPDLLPEEEWTGVFSQVCQVSEAANGSGPDLAACYRLWQERERLFRCRQARINDRLAELFERRMRLARMLENPALTGEQRAVCRCRLAFVDRIRERLLAKRYGPGLFSYEEIASLLSLPTGSVASLVYRIRRRFIREPARRPVSASR
jgi:DNA-directed RNA polymerase specialized sigma24 family protein